MCMYCKLNSYGRDMAYRIWYCQDKQKYTGFIYYVHLADQVTDLMTLISVVRIITLQEASKLIDDFIENNHRTLSRGKHHIYDEPWKNPRIIDILYEEFDFKALREDPDTLEEPPSNKFFRYWKERLIGLSKK